MMAPSLLERQSGRRVQHLTEHAAVVWSIAFSPNDQLLAGGSSDETIRLWSVTDGRCLTTIHLPGPYSGMNIAHATGLTTAQRETLKTLGAYEEEQSAKSTYTAPQYISSQSRSSPAPDLLMPSTLPHNLPRERTSLVGRMDEIAQVCELLLAGSRPLVTLVGEGGIGKSRLALAVAGTLVDATDVTLPRRLLTNSMMGSGCTAEWDRCSTGA